MNRRRFRRRREGVVQDNRAMRHGAWYPAMPCSIGLTGRGTHHTECNSTASRIAIQARTAGMPMSAAEALLLDWARKNRSPETGVAVSPDEVRQALAQAFALSCVSDGCRDARLRPYCRRDCVLYRYTHADGDREDRNKE